MYALLILKVILTIDTQQYTDIWAGYSPLFAAENFDDNAARCDAREIAFSRYHVRILQLHTKLYSSTAPPLWPSVINF